MLVAKRPSCSTDLLLKCIGQRSFKQLIQGTRLNLVLLRKMSVIGPEDIKDADCERGRVTQQPPIAYAQYKYPKWLSEPDSVKVRLPQGDQYVCKLMSDASNAETYLKWYQTYLRVLGEKELHARRLKSLPRSERSSSKSLRSSPRLLRRNSR